MSNPSFGANVENVGAVGVAPPRVVRSAVFVRDSLNKVRANTALTDKELRWYVLYQSSLRRRLKAAAICAHLSLAFFEPPASIHGVPLVIVVSVEFLCLLFFAAELTLKLSFKHNLITSKWTLSKLFVIMFCFLDVFVHFGSNYQIVHLTRVLRPFFLIEEIENLRLLIGNVLRTVVSVLDAIFLQLAVVVVFAVVAFLLETGVTTATPFIPDPRCSAEYPNLNVTHFNFAKYCLVHEGNCQKFSNIPDSLNRFFVLFTTTNFPDVMMCMVSRSRWYSLLFIVYLLVGTFFLMKLIVAIVYSQYRTHSKHMAFRHLGKIRFSLDAAFDELRVEAPRRTSVTTIGQRRGDGVVKQEDWVKLFSLLRPKSAPQLGLLLFHILDDQNNGYLTRTQFYNLFDLFHVDFMVRRKTGSLSPARVVVHTFRRKMRPLILHPIAEFIVDGLVFVNILLLLLAMSSKNLTHPLKSAIQVFPFIFAVEIAVKLIVLHPRRYLQSTQNRLDTLITLAGTVSYFVSLHEEVSVPHSVGNTILALRLFRVVRVLGHFPRFARIFSTTKDTFRTLRTFLALQVCFFYTFAILGMEFFANTVEPEHCACLQCPLKMYRNTFNDFATALITLFELMVVNNWQYNMDMHVNALGTRWVRAYFILFFFFGVLIMTNLVIAFVLEAFLLELNTDVVLRDRKLEIAALVSQVAESADLRPFKFEVVNVRVGLTAVLFNLHKDDIRTEQDKIISNRPSEIERLMLEDNFDGLQALVQRKISKPTNELCQLLNIIDDDDDENGNHTQQQQQPQTQQPPQPAQSNQRLGESNPNHMDSSSTIAETGLILRRNISTTASSSQEIPPTSTSRRIATTGRPLHLVQSCIVGHILTRQFSVAGSSLPATVGVLGQIHRDVIRDDAAS